MDRIELGDICQLIKGPYSVTNPGAGISIEKFSPLDEATNNSLSFCDDPRMGNFARAPLDILDNGYGVKPSDQDKEIIWKRIRESEAGVIILPDYMMGSVFYKEKTFIFVENPRVAFMNVVKHYYPGRNDGIHPTAVIMDCVVIGKRVMVGPYTIVGTISVANRRDNKGRLINFPQIGRVIIEDNVEIHSHVCIDRGALGDTVIGEGTKIDNLVHIAHNVKIGKHCFIVANVMLGGSCSIGDYSWIAPSVSILNGIKIGKNCTIGMGSVVMHDIPDNSVAYGVPAKVKNH